MPSTLLSDRELREIKPVNPFYSHLVRKHPDTDAPVISYGLSSYGYDIRLSPAELLIYDCNRPKLINPKLFDDNVLTRAKREGTAWILPGNTYALGSSLESFNLPRNITGICMGKSTYARCGIIVNITPLEAGWRGFLTIEISNCSSSDVLIYGGEGIAQVLFFESDTHPAVSYADRNGKYQAQPNKIITARV